MVNVGQGTRPPTRPASPKPKKVALRQGSSRLSDSEDTVDPVSVSLLSWKVELTIIAHQITYCPCCEGTATTGYQVPCALREGL